MFIVPKFVNLVSRPGFEFFLATGPTEFAFLSQAEHGTAL